MEKMTRTLALAFAITACADNKEVVEALQKIKASIEKKSASNKPTKIQMANEVTKEKILNYLATVEKATIKDIILNAEGCADLSSQKVTALTTALVNDHKVKRDEVKKVAYFSLITE